MEEGTDISATVLKILGTGQETEKHDRRSWLQSGNESEAFKKSLRDSEDESSIWGSLTGQMKGPNLETGRPKEGHVTLWFINLRVFLSP